MDHRFRWIVGFTTVLIAIVVGTIAYNAGVSHGLAAGAPAAGAAANAAISYRFHPWGFGFFPLGILFFWFLFARVLFWGGCGRRWHYMGPYYPGPHEPGSSFDEWHRRAHERMNNQPKE
jgi:hypothetical protein